MDARAQRILHGALTFACIAETRQPQKKVTGARGDKAEEKRPDGTKKMAHTDAAERQQADKKIICAPSRGSDRSIRRKKCCAPCRVDWTGQKKKGAARPAGCDRIKKFARQAASRSGSDRSIEKKMLRAQQDATG